MIWLNNVTKYFMNEQQKHYVLKNVTMLIPSGVNVGILGRNGAGKSTLLRLLGGIDFPNSGAVSSDMRFSWPMGLAGGFQASMTGRQNVRFVCRVYGKSTEAIERHIKEVETFAELGEYFDLPIKNYSSGMRSRLSFGLSLTFKFDCYLIDETLSVGDAYFKNKAKEALNNTVRNSNILLVSHSMPTLKDLCDAGIVVGNGQMQYFDDITEAIEEYERINTLKTGSQ